MLQPFHLALPVRDLAATRAFYGGLMGCTEGRSAPRWVDYDFFGHQLSLHLRPEECVAVRTNPVDGDDVPTRHFGVVLGMEAWEALRDRLHGQVEWVIEPHIRFAGEVGEQATMFFTDPSGNALEFKAFADQSQVFAVSPGGRPPDPRDVPDAADAANSRLARTPTRSQGDS